MANNQISILITAKDQASPAVDKVRRKLNESSEEAGRQSTLVQRLGENWSTFAGISAASGVALYGLFGQVQRATGAANQLESALIGLNSIARAFNQDANGAKRAAQELASDGLMTVADAATGLKNLLASGFSLDQAVTLMNRFKDSAAFGRQASLSFGQAISSATEGIKNGNSILVDNAGVTKNLSVMLTEAGFSAQDLMRATTDATIRQALFNGILKETNPQVGDAGRLAESAAGKQAQMAAQTQVLYQQIGLALQPALLAFLQTVTPIIQSVSQWISQNQGLASGIIITTGVVLAMVAGLGVLATAIKTAQVVAAVFGPTAAASFGVATTAFNAMRASMLVPIVLPALAIAAALASIAAVWNAWQNTKAAIEQERAANQAETNASIEIMRAARARYDRGEISEAQMRHLVGVAAKASGTNYAAGGLTLVGERGPELVNLPRGSQVSQAYRTAQAGSGAAPSQVIVNITGPVSFSDRSDIDYFAERISKTQRLAKAGMA